jgi:hypothetical protein
MFTAVNCKVRRLAVALSYLYLRFECTNAINPNIEPKPRLIVTINHDNMLMDSRIPENARS